MAWAESPSSVARPRLKRDLTFKLRERFGGEDNTAFKVGWLYDYDVGRELSS